MSLDLTMDLPAHVPEKFSELVDLTNEDEDDQDEQPPKQAETSLQENKHQPIHEAQSHQEVVVKPNNPLEDHESMAAGEDSVKNMPSGT